MTNTNTKRTFVGFGFGAIQAGLFLYEAHRSRNFSRLVVAEVVPDVVKAVRGNGGRFSVNVATQEGIERHEVGPVDIYNPRDDADRERLIEAIADASEMATALPSVQFYGSAENADPAVLLAEGIARKAAKGVFSRAVIYTAENHNHAAEILQQLLSRRPGIADAKDRFLCLNTVIGKMSGIATDARQIAEQNLAPVTPGTARAFLVEAFNRILITRISWGDFERGLAVFQEKENLLPFEEAKLYGHNATHALLGYLLRQQGREYMAEARDDAALLRLVRAAFIEESGKALCRKHRGLDALFTEEGYRAYADDLLERMLNPHLRDSVERVTRDPGRKLGWDDRLVGTMRVALAEGIQPVRYARGAAAAVTALMTETGLSAQAVLESVWQTEEDRGQELAAVTKLIKEAL